jgi:Family of unknown function (DUF6502)
LANITVPVRRATSTHQRDISAFARALVPVARLCIKSGLGAGELQIAAKIACISVAAETAILGKRLNHSRIAATTGLTRKEVRNLFSAVEAGGTARGKNIAMQRTTRVLHGWRTDPDYLDRHGSSLSLAIRGSGLTFQTLVKRYAGDVTPVSVLNELLRTGAVSVSGNRRVTARKITPRVKGYGAEVVAEVANRLRDLGATLVNNIERAETPIFVGFGEIPGLSENEATLFQTTFSERATSLLHDVDRWRASQTRIRTKNKNKDGTGRRVGLGVYLVSEGAPAVPHPVKPVLADTATRRRATS